MDLEFVCPDCQQVLSIQEARPGAPIRCLRCGYASVLPEQSEFVALRAKTLSGSPRPPLNWRLITIFSILFPIWFTVSVLLSSWLAHLVTPAGSSSILGWDPYTIVAMLILVYLVPGYAIAHEFPNRRFEHGAIIGVIGLGITLMILTPIGAEYGGRFPLLESVLIFFSSPLLGVAAELAPRLRAGKIGENVLAPTEE